MMNWYEPSWNGGFVACITFDIPRVLWEAFVLGCTGVSMHGLAWFNIARRPAF